MRTVTTLLSGMVLLSPIASQAETTKRIQHTDHPAQNQARRWVTFLEIGDRRAEAADLLLKMGAEAVPALVAGLDSPRPVVAQSVAHILRVLGSQAALAKDKLTTLSNSDDKQLAYLARYALFGVCQPGGITLVADYGNHKVLELDRTGKVVRTLTGLSGPSDAERLPNGNYLVCGFTAKKVVEMTPKGTVVWSFTKLKRPYQAQRLPNGNTLIADFGAGVFEVDRLGNTVWQYDGRLVQPLDAERLVNGNTLIVDLRTKRVIEVTPSGEVVWSWRGGQIVHDADRLPNGNTLMLFAREGTVVEVTPKRRVVRELRGLIRPTDADRLPNGHTLVAHKTEVAVYDIKGKKIWSARVGRPGEANRY